MTDRYFFKIEGTVDLKSTESIPEDWDDWELIQWFLGRTLIGDLKLNYGLQW